MIDIVTTRGSRLTQLSAFGVVPGSLIRLQQRRPAFIVLAGETEVTLDAEIAREIMVRAT